LNLPAGAALVGSTGRIGVTLPMDNVRAGIVEAGVELGSTTKHAENAAEAIMTSDCRHWTHPSHSCHHRTHLSRSCRRSSRSCHRRTHHMIPRWTRRIPRDDGQTDPHRPSRR
jgi:hypothetical protein